MYTLKEAKELGDSAVFSIESGKVLVTTEGSRFVEVESNVWAKVSDGSSEPTTFASEENARPSNSSYDNIRYVSASHHSGGVVVRPLYVYLEGKWINISTEKEAVFDELA